MSATDIIRGSLYNVGEIEDRIARVESLRGNSGRIAMRRRNTAGPLQPFVGRTSHGAAAFGVSDAGSLIPVIERGLALGDTTAQWDAALGEVTAARWNGARVLDGRRNLTLDNALDDMPNTGAQLWLPPGTYRVNANTTIPDYAELVMAPGAIINIASGVTLTIDGALLAGRYQIFSGSGTVTFGTVMPRVVDPIWWGAAYDNTTDDSAALQAAINAAGSTTPVLRSGGRVLISGRMAIGSRALISHKAAILEGLGPGYISTTSPMSSSIRWIGAADEPMIHVKDNLYGSIIRRLRLYGHATNRPRSAISYTRTAASGIGPSNQLAEDLWIGYASSDTGYTSSEGASFVDGIYGGDDYDSGIGSNNDMIQINRCFINGCTGYGIRQGSTQNALWTVKNTQAWSCAVGIRATATIDLEAVFFSGNTTANIEVPSTDDYAATVIAQVTGRDVSAEGCARFLKLDGAVVIDITGGYWQLSDTTPTGSLAADTKVIISENNSSQWITLRNYRFTTNGYTGAWIINLRSAAAGATAKALLLDNLLLVGSTAEPTFDMDTRGATDQRLFSRTNTSLFATGTRQIYRASNLMVGAADTIDLARWDAGAKTVRVGQRTSGEGAIDIVAPTDNFIGTLNTATLTGARTWTLPNGTTTLAGLATTQTFTGTNTFNANTTFAAAIITSAASAEIRSDTADGADTKRTYLAGGGGVTTARGSFVTVHGNEHGAAAGVIQLAAGNVASGTINFYTGNSVLRWQVNAGGHLVAPTDNTYDIGASGATRPKNIYLSGAFGPTGNITVPTQTGTMVVGESVNVVAPTSPDRTITVTIGGTTYYIHAKTTND